MNAVIHEAMSAHVSLLNRAFGATTRKVKLDRYGCPQLTESAAGPQDRMTQSEKNESCMGESIRAVLGREPHTYITTICVLSFPFTARSRSLSIFF
jgi:hypothetical protein